MRKMRLAWLLCIGLLPLLASCGEVADPGPQPGTLFLLERSAECPEMSMQVGGFQEGPGGELTVRVTLVNKGERPLMLHVQPDGLRYYVNWPKNTPPEGYRRRHGYDEGFMKRFLVNWAHFPQHYWILGGNPLYPSVFSASRYDERIPIVDANGYGILKEYRREFGKQPEVILDVSFGIVKECDAIRKGDASAVWRGEVKRVTLSRTIKLPPQEYEK